MRSYTSCLIASLVTNALAQTVTVSNGTILGGTCPSAAANFYHSIPFAQPPIGPLRFAAPQPYNQVFNGTLDGTKATPSCIQFQKSFTEPQPWSEDCLFLNVWTPKNVSCSSKLPVKVWVYGGSSVGGGISNPLYDGCNAATDSIFVSINYRLGPLGFLGLGKAGLLGNYAVQDLLLGLQWVQDNIDAFGGDRTKVLLFGQSAGAALSYTISTLPEATSLISAVVAESGGGRGSAPYAEAQPYFEQFVTNLGCTLEDLDCLRSASTQKLNASFPVSAESSAAAVTLAYAKGFGTVIDHEVIQEDPAVVGSRVPAIFGSTTADGSLFALQAYEEATAENYTTFVNSNFGPYASIVKEFYSPSKFANSFTAAITAIWTHASYTCSTQRGLKTTTSKGIPAYAYLWDVSPSCPWSPLFGSGNTQIMKLLDATHTSEIPFVLRNMEHMPAPNGTCSFSVSERKISDAISSTWTAVAKTQQPISPLLPGSWPAFSSNGTQGLLASNEDGVTIGEIDYSFCELWDKVTHALAANKASEK